MQGQPSGNRAGNSRGRNGMLLFLCRQRRKSAGVKSGGCGRAVIIEGRLPDGWDIDGVAASPDSRGVRLEQPKSEAHCYRRIDRISAALKNLRADCACRGVGAADRRIFSGGGTARRQGLDLRR